MLCARPFMQGMTEFGCGQCMPCRMNRRRLWTARLMLEAQRHEHSAFITLTYDKDHLPEGATLVPRDVQLFLKLIRKWYGKVRYYVVGEYGERNGRPHYHMALFGFLDTEMVLDTTPKSKDIVLKGLLKDYWPHGQVHFGTLTADSASYIVSYVVKRMTKCDDPRLNGRHPEFCRMSLKPGIGAERADDMSKAIRDCIDLSSGEIYGLSSGDVPAQFVCDGKRYPLGRYLRQRLRKGVGIPVTEPIICGELRSYARYVDLSGAGKRGWKVREDRRVQSELQAKGLYERSLSKKGIGL